MAILALPVAAGVIWALLRSPMRGRLLAVPSEDRWHEKDTPSFGGIGIFAGFSVGLWAAAAVGAFHADRAFVGIYAAIALVFACGLLDDLYGLRPLAKLAAQGAAAAIVIASGTHVQLVHNEVIGDAIAMVWLVGLANAFNLLDNMDGLAATLASIAFFFFAVDAVTVHPDDMTLAFSLAGACACFGFLPFNLRPRARALVFMGDSGSQTLGFSLAALGLVSSWKVAGTTVATLILPVLILAVPILDTTLVTIGAPARRAADPSGRPRPLLAPPRPLRPVESAPQCALLARSRSSSAARASPTTCSTTASYTLVGVVLTFVLLVQFASFLADVDRRPLPRGAARVHAGLRRALAPARRGARRLRPDHRVVPRPPT